MLRVAFADNASHAVALHNFAMLTDRLHACANFHRRSGQFRTKKLQTDSNSNQDSKLKQVDGLDDRPAGTCPISAEKPAKFARTMALAWLPWPLTGIYQQ